MGGLTHILFSKNFLKRGNNMLIIDTLYYERIIKKYL